MESPYRIFVVDDEQNIVKTWVLILKTRGYEVSGFFEPLEALTAIRNSPPHVLLSDVNLPNMSGIDLAITILEEKINTKVLLFSGQSETSALVEAAERRGYNFEVMPKPVGPQYLLSRLAALLE
jgi:DNA-binding NtrC family response regulator